MGEVPTILKVYAHTEEVRALEAGDSILCCPWVTDDEVIEIIASSYTTRYESTCLQGSTETTQLDGQRLLCQAL